MGKLPVRMTGFLGWTVLLAVCGCGRPTMIADDVVVMGGQPVPLTAYVGRKDLFDLHNDIRDVTVSFQVDGRRVGQAVVDQSGCAQVMLNASGDRPTSFQARADVRGQALEASGRIFYWEPHRVIVAVDMDHCIARTNYLRLLFGKHIPVSPPFDGAREVIEGLSKDYQILYLTVRPRSMLDRTRDWLEHYGFPPGPVMVSDRFEAVLRQLEWKRETLRQLREQYPALLVSIGNRKLDIESALPNHILPLTIQSIENDTEDNQGTVFLQDWDSLGHFFRVNRSILIDPERLSQAIREGATLQQPVRGVAGGYHYVQKCVNCQHEGIAGPRKGQGDSSSAQAQVEEPAWQPEGTWKIVAGEGQ